MRRRGWVKDGDDMWRYPRGAEHARIVMRVSEAKAEENAYMQEHDPTMRQYCNKPGYWYSTLHHAVPWFGPVEKLAQAKLLAVFVQDPDDKEESK